MKPTSIISMVIAVILIITGVVTCLIAQNTATANGDSLFAETQGDETKMTVSLNEVDVTKIELTVTDATVQIFGNSEKSYVEFVNFRENFYTMTTSNRTLNFREIPDVISMFKFWENGFSFKGLRHIFNFGADDTAPKAIRIYLKADHPIKIFTTEAENCNFTVSNLDGASDYNLHINTGSVNVEKLVTNSSFKLEGTSVTLNMKDSTVKSAEIRATELTMVTNALTVTDHATVTASTGDISIDSAVALDKLNPRFDSISGEVFINGVGFGSHYEADAVSEENCDITITTDSANIHFKHNVLGGN